MEPSAADVIKRYENRITKSPYDSRSYRGVKLRNNLRAMLISDPTTNKSSACLSVGAGSLNEPRELPGLAHFLEHMLFRGSKKYPVENDYNKFVTEHAGFTNAITFEDQTYFYFKDIDSDFLTAALDRFAQFFLEPLMSASAIEREVISVNYEYEKTIHDDDCRLIQLQSTMSKEDHPYNRFTAGNLETLDTVPKSKGINVRNKLLEFHSSWYSSNIMCLAVLGKESLDVLEKTIVSSFGNIENKNVERIVYEEHPYGPEQLKRKFYVVPVEEVSRFEITFPIPDFTDQYRTAPDLYVSNLIRHPGPAGLQSVLRAKGVCYKVRSKVCYPADGFGFFDITVDLLERAVDRVDEVVTLIFEYIDVLKTKGIQEWIFRENQKLYEMNFLYDESSKSSYVRNIALSMHYHPIEDVLSYKYLHDEWDPSLMKRFLSYLNPDNMNITILSKSFENIADRVERWYGTRYKVETIPNNLIENWKTIEVSAEFQLPLPNEFIPENFATYPLGRSNEPKNPYVIHESPVSQIWFKQIRIRTPKLYVVLQLFTPISSRRDRRSAILREMFAHLLRDELDNEFFPASFAGFEWDFHQTKSGYRFELYGYSEKLPLVLEKFLYKMTNIQVDEERFDILKDSYIRSLQTFATKEPSKQAAFYLHNFLIYECGWTPNDLLAAKRVFQRENLVTFMRKQFSRLYIQGFIYGNSDEQKAEEIANIIETPFKAADGILLQHWSSSRLVEVDDGGLHYIYEVFNKCHKNSCYNAYFQCNSSSTSNCILAELFVQIVEEPFCNTLRTKEQLGYDVRCYHLHVNKIPGFAVLVESEKHPVYVDSRVEEFLRNIYKKLEDMSNEEFETHKAAVASNLRQKPSELMDTLNFRYWTEIETFVWNFDRADVEIEQLYSFQKIDVLNFFKEWIDESSKKRRKLAIHVISEKMNPVVPKDVPNEGIRINDIVRLRSFTSLLLPLPSPWYGDWSTGD